MVATAPVEKDFETDRPYGNTGFKAGIYLGCRTENQREDDLKKNVGQLHRA